MPDGDYEKYMIREPGTEMLFGEVYDEQGWTKRTDSPIDDKNPAPDGTYNLYDIGKRAYDTFQPWQDKSATSIDSAMSSVSADNQFSDMPSYQGSNYGIRNQLNYYTDPNQKLDFSGLSAQQGVGGRTLGDMYSRATLPGLPSYDPATGQMTSGTPGAPALGQQLSGQVNFGQAAQPGAMGGYDPNQLMSQGNQVGQVGLGGLGGTTRMQALMQMDIPDSIKQQILNSGDPSLYGYAEGNEPLWQQAGQSMGQVGVPGSTTSLGFMQQPKVDAMISGGLQQPYGYQNQGAAGTLSNLAGGVSTSGQYGGLEGNLAMKLYGQGMGAGRPEGYQTNDLRNQLMQTAGNMPQGGNQEEIIQKMMERPEREATEALELQKQKAQMYYEALGLRGSGEEQKAMAELDRQNQQRLGDMRTQLMVQEMQRGGEESRANLGALQGAYGALSAQEQGATQQAFGALNQANVSGGQLGLGAGQLQQQAAASLGGIEGQMTQANLATRDQALQGLQFNQGVQGQQFNQELQGAQEQRLRAMQLGELQLQGQTAASQLGMQGQQQAFTNQAQIRQMEQDRTLSQAGLGLQAAQSGEAAQLGRQQLQTQIGTTLGEQQMAGAQMDYQLQAQERAYQNQMAQEQWNRQQQLYGYQQQNQMYGNQMAQQQMQNQLAGAGLGLEAFGIYGGAAERGMYAPTELNLAQQGALVNRMATRTTGMQDFSQNFGQIAGGLGSMASWRT